MATTSKGSLKIKVLARKKRVAAKRVTGELPETMKAMAAKNRWDRWEIQERELTSDHLELYMKMKQRLAAFEKMAMYYFFEGKDLTQMTKRADRLKKHLNKLALETFEMGGEMECPIGMCLCRGECWDCPCPDPEPNGP